MKNKTKQDVIFTESELKVMAFDYEGLIKVSEYMGTTISGDADLAQSMVNTEVVRRQLFEKIKKFMPKTKEEYSTITPTRELRKKNKEALHDNKKN